MVNKIFKCALITGAANGIGYSILKRLVSANIDVTAVDKDEKQLKKICSEIESSIKSDENFTLTFSLSFSFAYCMSIFVVIFFCFFSV